MIGLEALLLKKEEQELGYRLALRGSVLLTADRDDRRRLFEELRVAYKCRSVVAHGDALKASVKVNDRDIQFIELVMLIDNHLRSALRAFLDLSKEHSEAQIIDLLDNAIVSGTTMVPI